MAAKKKAQAEAAPKTPAKHPGGRPSDFTQEIADEICGWLAEGKSLARFCRERDIGYCNVMRWLGVYPKFSEDYARAREEAGHADADAVTDVKERMLAGEITPEMARVAIDASKWTAGIRKPKKYGPKLDVDATVTGDIRIVIGGGTD